MLIIVRYMFPDQKGDWVTFTAIYWLIRIWVTLYRFRIEFGVREMSNNDITKQIFVISRWYMESSAYWPKCFWCDIYLFLAPRFYVIHNWFKNNNLWVNLVDHLNCFVTSSQRDAQGQILWVRRSSYFDYSIILLPIFFYFGVNSWKPT